VPAESARFSRRLGPRDRWFIALSAVVTVVAVVAILFAMRGSESGARDATRCVVVESAGFMGAIHTQYCDAKATSACRRLTDREKELPAQCAKLAPALRP
jgi:type VI protein secretion system component VasK